MDPIRCTSFLRFGHTARFCRVKHHFDPTSLAQHDTIQPSSRVAPTNGATLVDSCRTTTHRCVAPPPTPPMASVDDATLMDVPVQPLLLDHAKMFRTELRDYLSGLVLFW